MNALARIELACARFVEEAFARVFPSELDSAQVGRKLVAVMQATPSDTYLVRVHPDDYARFAGDRDFLEARWSALLRDALPADRNVAPRAILHEDARIVSGSLAIEAVTDERPPVQQDPLLLELPSGLLDLAARSERLFERVRHLDRRMYVEPADGEEDHTVRSQFDRLRQAFGDF